MFYILGGEDLSCHTQVSGRKRKGGERTCFNESRGTAFPRKFLTFLAHEFPKACLVFSSILGPSREEEWAGV